MRAKLFKNKCLLPIFTAWLLWLMFLSCVSIRKNSSLSDSSKGEMSFNVVCFKQKSINAAILKLLKQFPPNIKGEVYVLTIRRNGKRKYIVVQNWGVGILQSAKYSSMGVWASQDDAMFLLCYDNKKSRSELEKLFSKSKESKLISLQKEQGKSIGDYQEVYDDINTYLFGEIKDDSIEVKKLIINNRIVKNSSVP